MHHENFCKLPNGDVRTEHQLVTTDQEFPLDVSICPIAATGTPLSDLAS